MSALNKIFNCMILIYVIMFPLLPVNLKIKGFSLGDFIFFIIVLFYLLLIISKKQSRGRFIKGIRDFFNDYLSLPMFLLLVLMLSSISYAKEKTLAFSESLRFLYYIILYFIIKYETRSRSIFNSILKVYIAVSSIISAFGIVQYFTKIGLDEKFIYDPKKYSVPVRITSTLDNPNTLGAFLILVIFPTIMLAIYAEKKSNKLIYSVASILMFINIGLSFSRSAWLALDLGAFLLIVLYNWKAILLPILGVVLALIVPAIRNRLGDFSIIFQDPRISTWKIAIKMIKDHPILGVGNGNYVSLYGEYVSRFPELMYNHNTRFPSHNSYLKVQSELGILGTMLFIIILIAIFIKLKKFLYIEKELQHKIFFKGFFISAIVFLFMNIFDNLFFVPKVSMYFWILVAIFEGIIYNSNCQNNVH